MKALLFVLVFALSLFSRADGERFELMHIWKEDSERGATQVLKQAFLKKHDVTWVERASPSFEQLRRSTLLRLLQGYPPNAVLWYPSGELDQLQEQRVLNDYDNTAKKIQLEKKIPKVILHTISRNGRYVLLPTNIHIENWLWFNRHIYEELNLDYPRSWNELIAQVKIISAAGYEPIAMGRQMWSKRILYVTILVSIDREAYRDFIFRGTLQAVEHPSIKRAFEIMASLREQRKMEKIASSWAEATGLVTQNKAALIFMGDWVKNEFKLRGAELGVDYDCRIAPNSQNKLLLVVDGFIFPKTTETETENSNLHNLFSEVALDANVQHDFSLEKGSIPVVKGVSSKKFDACGKRAMELYNREENLLLSPTSINILDHSRVIESVTNEFWNTDMPPDQAVENLKRELEAVNSYLHAADQN